MNFIKQLNNNSLQLCCGGNNCPIVNKLDDNTIEIQDDDGNKVKMKTGQALLIADAVKKLEAPENDLLLG